MVQTAKKIRLQNKTKQQQQQQQQKKKKKKKKKKRTQSFCFTDVALLPKYGRTHHLTKFIVYYIFEYLHPY